MRFHDGALIFSATDVVNFLGCSHSTYLDRLNLDKRAEFGEEDPMLALLQEKGMAHEQRYLETLEAAGKQVVEIPGKGAFDERHIATIDAMRQGAEVIYQGALSAGQWQGYADFLIRVPEASALGDYRYEAVDTKLAQSAKPSHALQLSVYSMLLAAEQGKAPQHMRVVLGDNKEVTIRVSDLQYYFAVAGERLQQFLHQMPEASVGEPCGHCGVCRWSDTCEAEWERTDHLSLVAGISRSQRAKLEMAGVSTMSALAALDEDSSIAGLQPAMLKKIRNQARLQVAKTHDGGGPLISVPKVPVLSLGNSSG